ncbi:hypothetical protein J1614_007761 [Plenodomus biglobosus]|nr:hypothetical protein J1614_007761 [Plenodomus biglobosus]
MHFCSLFAVSVALISSAHAQFSGYYNISTALRVNTPTYLHYQNVSRTITSHERYESLQQWYFTGSQSGYYFIANRQGGVITAVGSGQQVRGDQFDPNMISHQAWKVIEVADGLYEFESKEYPGNVLDIFPSSTVDYPAVLVAPRNIPRARNQLWMIGKPTIDTIGTYGW